MRSLNADPEVLLQRYMTAPESIDDEDAFIPLGSMLALLEASASATGCSDFGLRLAQGQDMRFLGPIATAMQRLPTISDALRISLRHMFFQCPRLFVDVTEGGHLNPNSIELRIKLNLNRQPQQQQAISLFLEIIHRTLNFLICGQYDSRAVAPSDGASVAIYKSNNFIGLHVDRSALTSSLHAENEPLLQLSTEYLSSYIRNPLQSFSSRVHCALEKTLHTTQGRKAAVAHMLNIHPRTLQRKLQEENTSFEEILEKVRKQMALRYLCEPRIQLVQIARVIGLSQQSVLTRKCWRWFGQTPTAVRRRRSEYLSNTGREIPLQQDSTFLAAVA